MEITLKKIQIKTIRMYFIIFKMKFGLIVKIFTETKIKAPSTIQTPRKNVPPKAAICIKSPIDTDLKFSLNLIEILFYVDDFFFRYPIFESLSMFTHRFSIRNVY